MAQTITDFQSFLKDAEEAVLELSDLTKKSAQLKQEEERLERVLQAEKKAAGDSVNSTVRRRREEIGGSYDAEIGKLQDRLKKTRIRREKAKSQGIKERIREETKELHEYNRELSVKLRAAIQADRAPFFCKSSFYYTLYFPRGIREILTLILTFAACFFLIPYGIYLILPVKKTLYLVLIYLACILVFGGMYILVGNVTKDRHLKMLQEGRAIRSLISSNNRKIRVITSSIRKDRDEAAYNLEKFDDDIAQLDQDLSETIQKKKDALNVFENVTKTIIMDEIMGNCREKIESLEEAHGEAQKRLRITETMLKEKKIYITDTYESYVGREFLSVERLKELRRILESGEAGNISEAIEVYRSRRAK
ncbi:hypothetical protein D3Z50_01760 [Clostridiaceae bacterium]|jgi:hypothetical protein|nr:hypothetical protein [Clostridium sp.]NBI69810.1 hypothetical protein [Clostridiaceae bacterium]